MVIEFFGASCTGKSTLIRDVAVRLGEVGIQVEVEDTEAGRKRRSDVLRGLVDPRWAWWFVANMRVVSRFNRRRLVRSVGAARRVRERPGVLLLDEGPLKWASTVLPGSRAISVVLKALPEPALAVHVVCDFDERLDRMRDTSRSHAKGMGDDALRERDRVKGLWNDRLIRTLAAPVLRADTTGGRRWSSEVCRKIVALRAEAGRSIIRSG